MGAVVDADRVCHDEHHCGTTKRSALRGPRLPVRAPIDVAAARWARAGGGGGDCRASDSVGILKVCRTRGAARSPGSVRACCPGVETAARKARARDTSRRATWSTSSGPVAAVVPSSARGCQRGSLAWQLGISAASESEAPYGAPLHPNLAAAGTPLSRLPDRRFAGFPRVCALSIRTSVTCADG